jgi:uncharacterized protein (DUF2236 family)
MADPGMVDVVREGGLLLGGGRAILLQVAHAPVGRGVAEHSDFASRQLNRLRATMTYIYGVTYGSPAARARIAAEVTAVHRDVHGPGYDALDPRLQLWVAATLYDTGLLLYQRWFGPLSEAVAERIYREYRVLGTTLQMSPELWPANRAEFREYWQDMLATITVGEHARQVCRDLLFPRRLPAVLRPAMPLNRLVTAGLLPARIRDGYGLPWGAGRRRRFEMVMSATAAVYPRIPRAIRVLPSDYYFGRRAATG